MISSFFRNHLSSVFYEYFLKKSDLSSLNEEAIVFMESLCSIDHFVVYFSAPFLSESHCIECLNLLMKDSSVSASSQVVSFLLLLIRYKALKYFFEIKKMAEDKKLLDHSSLVKVDVYATDLTDSELLDQAKKVVESQLGVSCIWVDHIDNSMLAGIRFQVGDVVIEKSVSRNLMKLRDQLVFV